MVKTAGPGDSRRWRNRPGSSRRPATNNGVSRRSGGRWAPIEDAAQGGRHRGGRRTRRSTLRSLVAASEHRRVSATLRVLRNFLTGEREEGPEEGERRAGACGRLRATLGCEGEA